MDHFEQSMWSSPAKPYGVAPKPDPAIMGRVWAGNAIFSDKTAFRAWSDATNQDLMARSEQEMQSGAKIVFWAEISSQVLKDDEAAFVARGASLAAKCHAYLGMALVVLNQGKSPTENKFVLIQPDGRVAWEYNKAHPVLALTPANKYGETASSEHCRHPTEESAPSSASMVITPIARAS